MEKKKTRKCEDCIRYSACEEFFGKDELEDLNKNDDCGDWEDKVEWEKKKPVNNKRKKR
jgi:hypothetical protein